MRLSAGEGVLIRSYAATDLSALVRLADDRRIWQHLRNRFPHPYTEADGLAWLALAEAMRPETHFALALEPDEELVGGIGLILGADVYVQSAELGYWLGEPYWGRGIATRAVRAICDWAFATFELERIHAGVFDWNPASARVLEKAGFTLEARLRRHVTKGGRVGDELVFARLRSEPA
ncbi:MAG: GNAT family N-acetyltransferase [Deltaproteobacteria bacterium]|nr:GNAT family N-acetyltransferase [Deltaproteobacteria bacterium]